MWPYGVLKSLSRSDCGSRKTIQRNMAGGQERALNRTGVKVSCDVQREELGRLGPEFMVRISKIFKISTDY